MFDLLMNVAETFAGRPWTVYLHPFNILILLATIAPMVLLVLIIPYIWAKSLDAKANMEAIKAESKESKEAAEAFKQALRRENSAYIHAERKRFYPELQNWIAELKADGINASWKWQIGSCRDIQLKFENSGDILPCSLQFAELGKYVQLVGATYIDDGREKSLPGTILEDVPYDMYVTYFKALILYKTEVLSLLVSAAETKSVKFDYCITLSQKREFVTENQFNAFLSVLAEEVMPAGLKVTGDFDTLEVTLSKQ